MANILITGANGQLGSELRKIGFSPLDEVFFTDVAELDITDYTAIEKFIQVHEVDTIINCAAYTAVDRAEDEPGPAAEINTQAVANLAKAAQKEDCLLIHISTDYVFDGTATTPYTEKIKTCPVSVYGKTKLAGEEAIIRSGCFYIIIRTAWLYSAFGHNFVKTILRLAEERPEINVVNDQIGTPTYTYDLARLLVDMIETEKYGYYHATNEGGYISWYDFTKEIFRQAVAMGREEYSEDRVSVAPVTTAEYGVSKAKRPFNSRLDKSKLVENGFEPLPTWQDAVARYLKEIEF